MTSLKKDSKVTSDPDDPDAQKRYRATIQNKNTKHEPIWKGVLLPEVTSDPDAQERLREALQEIQVIQKHITKEDKEKWHEHFIHCMNGDPNNRAQERQAWGNLSHYDNKCKELTFTKEILELWNIQKFEFVDADGSAKRQKTNHVVERHSYFE